jgi:glycosyltransferase involved in cell wall biosynthesis
MRFRPTARLPFRVLAVGRLVEKKAPHLTIRAFAEVARRFPEARLDMIGDGPLMDRCRALVEEHGLATRVRLHGAQPSNVVARFMAEASLFVQHSVTAPNGDTEGFGISLIEAMASEVPLVVTRHNGFVEIVLDGETGLLVDEHDVSGMAEAMATLLGDTDRARAMGEAGRRRVLANFTHDHVRDRLRAIMGFPPFTGTAATLETGGLDEKTS